MKYALAWVGGIIALFWLCVGLWALAFGISWFTAKPLGKLQARQQIYSGSNVIAQYDHFFNLCASVQTAEQAIAASEAQLNNTKNSDDRAIIETNITANKIERADAVNTYNADASATYTKGQFLASNLPFRLPITIPAGGTQCAN